MSHTVDQMKDSLRLFIDKVLRHHPAVQGVVGIDMVATAQTYPDAGIQAMIFLDPFDWYIVPAEFLWQPSDLTFHDVFTEDTVVQQEGIKITFRRFDFQRWSSSQFTWQAADCYDLATGWLTYDREHRLAPLIAQRTRYDEETQLKHLDRVIVELSQSLLEEKPKRMWDTVGALIAHDWLEASYAQFVAGLFALNKTWLPARHKQMRALLQLEWLPANFTDRILLAANAPSLDYAGYQERVRVLEAMFWEFLDQLTADGLYDNLPIEQAIVRYYDEPGYSWNMTEWNQVVLTRAIAIKKQRE